MVVQLLIRAQRQPELLDHKACMQAGVAVQQPVRLAKRTQALEQGAQAPAWE